MKQKSLLLTVLGLAFVSFLVVAVIGGRGMPFSGMMGLSDRGIEPGFMMKGGFGGVDVAYQEDFAPDLAVSSRMPMIEPSIGFFPPYYDDFAPGVLDRSYEKYSYHGVVVRDVTTYMRSMREYVLSVNGVVMNYSVHTQGRYNSGSLTARIPTDRFDEAVARVTEDVKEVVTENISAYDITGQVVGAEQNLQNLMDQKSIKEAELLEATTEVQRRRIQIEIDRLDRQIENAQSLIDSTEQRVEYSTVSITAADNARYFDPGTSGDFRDELSRAWDSLKMFVKFLAAVGVWVLVYSIIWLPIVWFASWLVRRFRKVK
jgi:hypothetical protein